MLSIEIKPHDRGYQVSTTHSGGNGWALGVTLRTLAGARRVAGAIAAECDQERVTIEIKEDAE